MLILIVLVILARATHHMVIKKPGKIVKRAAKAEFEARFVKMEDIMRAKGYLP